MSNLNKTYFKNMKVEELQQLMQEAGVVFSTDIKKEELVKLAVAQKDQIEEYISLKQYDENQVEATPDTDEVINDEVVEEPIAEVDDEVNNEEEIVDKIVADLPTEDAIEEPVIEEIVEKTETNETAVIEMAGAEVEAPIEVAERVQQIQDNAFDIVADVIGEDAAAIVLGEEKPKQKPKGRGGRGKKIIVTKNGEPFGEFGTIKKCAEHFKELFELKALPFNHIMKSTRTAGLEPWTVDKDVYMFVFENEQDILTPKQKAASLKPEDVISQKIHESEKPKDVMVPVEGENYEEIDPDQEQFLNEIVGDEVI